MASPSTLTNLQGICPVPFLQEDHFPAVGGFLPGRFCMPIAFLNNTACCLPCPASDWTYRDGFQARTEIASWVNVAALFLTAFLLLSFLVLPVKWTHRHYLSICLTIGVSFLELAFVVPLAAQPEKCHNEITPNDMVSDKTCAISGAFVIFGGWATVIWVFCRAVSLHLQICWELVPGKKFFYTALVVGWGIPAAGLALTMSLTGVSYRFGSVCHINHKDGLEDIWGPILAFAALGAVFQFITLGYCIQVYIKSLLDDKTTTDNSSSLPTYSGSISTASARQTYRRVKRVVQLQWRGATVVLLIIAETVFFAVVFVSMDNGSQITLTFLQAAEPWLECLVITKGNKDLCLPKAKNLVKPEAVVLAVLIVLGLSGFWCFIFLGRWSMFLGWKDLIKRRLLTRHEFVSADARRLSSDPRTYEMLSSKLTPALNTKSPDAKSPDLRSPDKALMSPNSTKNKPFSTEQETRTDYFGKGRSYVSPVSSYSSPRPPSSSQAREWDPKTTHARAEGKSYGAS